MKYTKEEYNNKLLLELEYNRNNDTLSDKLKVLLFDLAFDIVSDIGKADEYKFLDDNVKLLAVVFAYEDCVKYAFEFDRKKSLNPYPYMLTIIKKSFTKALSIVREENKLSPPTPPLSRIIRKGCTHTCPNCGSSYVRESLLSRKRKCINKLCPNSK